MTFWIVLDDDPESDSSGSVGVSNISFNIASSDRLLLTAHLATIESSWAIM